METTRFAESIPFYNEPIPKSFAPENLEIKNTLKNLTDVVSQVFNEPDIQTSSSCLTLRNIQCTTMPSELRKAWASIPVLKNMTDDLQIEFSLVLHSALKKALSDPDKYITEVYFSNKPKEIPKSSSFQPPKSFYIKIDEHSQSAIIAINTKKTAESLLGNGTNKIVYLNYELSVPLPINGNIRGIENLKKAVARSTKSEFSFRRVLRPTQIHKRIYDLLESEGKPGRVSDPQTLREHITDSGQKKQELIQTFYPGDFEILKNKGIYHSEYESNPIVLTYEQRLLLIEEVLETLASLHSMGIVHRDIKALNILLKEEAGVIHPYVHDFDMVVWEQILEFKADYLFWDLAGQLGFVTHASDLIGAMITACEVCFLTKLDYSDLDHKDFKKGPIEPFVKYVYPNLSLELINAKLPLLEVKTQDNIIGQLYELSKDSFLTVPQRNLAAKLWVKTIADFKILQIFCNVFHKEDSWKDMLVASCICYFAGLSGIECTQLPQHEIKYKFDTAVEHWIKAQLLDIFDVIDLEKLGFKQTRRRIHI